MRKSKVQPESLFKLRLIINDCKFKFKKKKVSIFQKKKQFMQRCLQPSVQHVLHEFDSLSNNLLKMKKEGNLVNDTREYNIFHSLSIFKEQNNNTTVTCSQRNKGCSCGLYLHRLTFIFSPHQYPSASRLTVCRLNQ